MNPGIKVIAVVDGSFLNLGLLRFIYEVALVIRTHFFLFFHFRLRFLFFNISLVHSVSHY